MDLIKLNQIEGTDSYSAYWGGRVYIGEFFKDVSGYYVWLPNPHRKGYWVAGQVRAIADKLDEMNSCKVESDKIEFRSGLEQALAEWAHKESTFEVMP